MFDVLPTDAEGEVLGFLSSADLRCLACTSKAARAKYLANGVWQRHAAGRWGLSESACRRVESEGLSLAQLHVLASPSPNIREVLKGTFLRYESDTAAVGLRYVGALGEGDRAVRAEKPLGGEHFFRPRPPRISTDRRASSLEGLMPMRRRRSVLRGRSLSPVSPRTPKTPLAPAKCLAERARRFARSMSLVLSRKALAKVVALHEAPRPFSTPWVSSKGNAIRVAPRLVSYFELRLADDTEPNSPVPRRRVPPCVAVGLSTSSFDAEKMMPGWDVHSWGYHSDDGGVFHADGSAARHEEPFGRGDVVGCGFDHSDRRLFFTRGGVQLATCFVLSHDVGPLYPTIGIDDSALVVVNFGTEPFKFDLDAYVDQPHQRRRVARALAAAAAPVPPPRRALLPALTVLRGQIV
ncbi:hypothetical protein M885DRAFT_613791 [Pelagophyceae sp. CCMP2097]|nr:hypothetical protein M885DRAFT_613791 [Pelagophyceae sp. CCMP2097]